jgi:ABC-type sugar transport system permease subunit
MKNGPAHKHSILKKNSSPEGTIKDRSWKRMFHLSYERSRQERGWFFVFPFLVGFAVFFLFPALQSIQFSFSTVIIGEDPVSVGWENYQFLLNRNPQFKTNMIATFQTLIPQVAIIIFFSLFVAVILNQKFFGRVIVRALFFLPVIITAGAVMMLMRSQIFADAGNVSNVYLFKSTALRDMLLRSGFSGDIVYRITTYVNSIFTYTWKSGVQILLFLAALQGVPKMYYEAASVEGASTWDSFWKITLPLISPVLFTNIIYTIVDTFTDTENPVLKSIYVSITKDHQFGLGSAQAWMYFAVIVVVVAIAYLWIGRRTDYISE